MRREATQFYIPILLAIMLAAALTYYWLEINRRGPVPEPATALRAKAAVAISEEQGNLALHSHGDVVLSVTVEIPGGNRVLERDF